MKRTVTYAGLAILVATVVAMTAAAQSISTEMSLSAKSAGGGTPGANTSSPLSQQETDYVQVLAPFDTLLLNGAGGERWSAELRVRNSADVAVNLFPETCRWIALSFPCEARIDVPPNTTKVVDVLTRNSFRNPGVLLYVPAAQRENVDFTLTVRNVGSGDGVGTSVPVVRVSQLLPRARIIGVPISSDYRRTLRVYDPFLPVMTVFRVHVIDEATNTVITDREYLRGLPTDPVSPYLVPETFDFSDALASADSSGAERVTVVVERVWPALGFWPMISLTSNSDGRITVFTPH